MEDYFQYRGLKPTVRNLFAFFLLNPGFRAGVLFRVQDYLILKKHLRLASFISSVNQFLTGAEFTPGCQIGPGLVVRHPSGIVIGGNTSIGKNLVIHQGVTIGEKFRTENSYSGSPILGNNINVGANSVVVGEIILGDNLIIGALSLVNSDFLKPGTLIGSPARYIST